MDAKAWESALTKAGVSPASSKVYAASFATAKLTLSNLVMIDKETLQELGVTVLGDILSVLQLAKQQAATAVPAASSTQASVKLPSVKAPQLHAEMTAQQFRKFKVDWSVFREMTNIPEEKVHAQLYSNADESVQTAIINTYCYRNTALVP